MTVPEHLTITGPEDILGFIPHSLGYWPSDSLVAMTMQGKRLGATLRVDLPDIAADPDLRQFSRTVSTYLEADDAADGTLLVLFTNNGWTNAAGGGGAPDGPERSAGHGEDHHRALLAALGTALDAAGMPVRDAWFVGDVYWRNANCSDPLCCPLRGRPVDEIRDSRLNAEMVFRGSSVREAPAALASGVPSPAEPVDQRVGDFERQWGGELSGRRRSRRQFDDVLDVWTCVMSGTAGGPLSPALAGYLRACLRVPPWRDAILVMTAAGRQAAELGAEQFGIFDADDGLPVVASPLERPAAGPERGDGARGAGAMVRATVPGYGDVLLGLAPAVPDWRGLGKLERLLLELARCGGGEAKAAALTALGWIEWCRGRGSFAHALLNQAAGEHPGYRLAELLAEVVRRGTLCGWAARRESAWQRFEPDAA